MVCEEGHKLGAASGAGAGAGAGAGDGAQCFIQPNSSLVLSASFDSARLIGQIRLTAVGGTIEMSRPMWEIAMSMGDALGGLLWEALRYGSHPSTRFTRFTEGGLLASKLQPALSRVDRQP